LALISANSAELRGASSESRRPADPAFWHHVRIQVQVDQEVVC
jgi:hypothetical protein